MNELLLVLILLTDPSARPAADAVAQRLADQGPAQVVIGPDALAQLKVYGLTDGDLQAQPNLGATLTGRERKLAIVQIDRQLRGGNVVVQSVVWVGGRREQHVAISGTTHAVPPKPDAPASAGPKVVPDEPLDSVARGVGTILVGWQTGGGTSPTAELDSRLAGLADQKEWLKIIEFTEGEKTPSPRMRYYRILALMNRERPAEAEAAFAEFRTAAPKHVLLDALDQILHPVAKPAPNGGADINNAPADDDGTNILR